MADVTRKELKKQIKDKAFSNIYLLYGQEKMYVKADTQLLVTKLMGKEPPEFNYHSFKRDISIDEIAVAVQVVPFLSEYNCVKVSDLDFNDMVKADFEKFMAVLENIPDTTVLIITMPTLEQNPKSLGANFKKVLKLVQKQGTVCVMNQESDISLARQIVKWADSRGIKIEQADAYKIQEYVGFDLNAIKNELDKLCNYVGDDGYITTEQVELLTTKRLEANIFNLTDAIISGNGTKAFEILDVLFYQKEEPTDVVNVISLAYIDFYRVRVAVECGIPMKEIAKDFGYGKREFVLNKAVSKIKKVSTTALRESLDEIVSVSAKLRSVSANRRILTETLVAKLLMLSAKGE